MHASKQWKETIIARLNGLCPSGKISLIQAQEAIASSAWWEAHPSGPVRARGHAQNVKGKDGLWYIDFGANTFLITRSISRCCNLISNWISQHDGEILPDAWVGLYSSLARTLRGSVSNYNGEEYDYYSAGTEDKILFGTQAISITGFLRFIAYEIDLHEIYYFKYPSLRPRYRTTPSKQKQQQPTNKCPWCHATVSPKNMQKHMSSRCPKRPR